MALYEMSLSKPGHESIEQVRSSLSFDVQAKSPHKAAKFAPHAVLRKIRLTVSSDSSNVSRSFVLTCYLLRAWPMARQASMCSLLGSP